MRSSTAALVFCLLAGAAFADQRATPPEPGSSHQAQLEQLRSLPKPTDRAGNREASPAQRVLPAYPPELKDKVSGDVTLSVLVSDQGEPLDVALVKSSGNDLLDRAGIANVRQWTFYPRLLRGNPVESRLTVTVRFRAVP